jgi:preprotein translocase SecF subunit
MMQLFTMPNFEFTKYWGKALCFSGLMIVLLVAMFFVRGKNMLGIDFVGGSSITYSYAQKGNTSEMAQTLAQNGYAQAMVTYKSGTGDAGEIMEVRLRGDDPDADATAKKIGQILAKAYPKLGIKADSAYTQHLDGLIGREFTKTALIAVVLALVGIGVYIVLRYEFSYAIASVLALLHDVLVVLAVYLACGRTISLTTVAAFLTVIGYSINDTVVVFDRLRENIQINKGNDLASLVNLSINQTLNRTFLTSFTTFIVVFVMWVGGSPEINDFVYVMMLGIILGTYSSVMLSGPFVAWRAARKAAKANGGK